LFTFNMEPELRLLTAMRTGIWSLDVVVAYEAALRLELAELHMHGPRTAFIIDIRSCGSQAKAVADALRVMVAGLGPLRAAKTAIVTSSGLTKLRARMGDPNAQVFTSMISAREWVLDIVPPGTNAGLVHDEPGDAVARGASVHVLGPAEVDVTLTPQAALETARRIGDAALEVLIGAARADKTAIVADEGGSEFRDKVVAGKIVRRRTG
jgi:hypothetical protein